MVKIQSDTKRSPCSIDFRRFFVEIDFVSEHTRAVLNFIFDNFRKVLYEQHVIGRKWHHVVKRKSPAWLAAAGSNSSSFPLYISSENDPSNQQIFEFISSMPKQPRRHLSSLLAASSIFASLHPESRGILSSAPRANPTKILHFLIHRRVYKEHAQVRFHLSTCFSSLKWSTLSTFHIILWTPFASYI